MTSLPSSDATHWMKAALALAATSMYVTSPNPRVGCILVSADNQAVGSGATQAAGQAHAEILALQNAAAAGNDVRGATAYVTLEPCAHQGRTGPCCDALIAAGIHKVVASIEDPNPMVSGRGLDRLCAAGVEVEVGLGAEASRELNIGFFSRMVRGTPWLRLKVAASLDGTTALNNGESQWITSPAAREDGHAWRARACAVLTGIGTVLADDPRLDVRSVSTPRQPQVVVVDSDLKTPPAAQMFMANRAVTICAGAGLGSDFSARRAALEARGATVLLLPGKGDGDGDGDGRVDLPAMLRALAARGVNELHVEAGQRLNGALLRAGLVDELLLYFAPKLLGPGRGMADLPVLSSLSKSVELEFREVQQVGTNLRVLARLQGRERF